MASQSNSYEKDEFFRLLVSNVRDYAIFALDLDGNVVTWNEGARRMTGCERGEAIGQNVELFYLPADRQRQKPAQQLRSASVDGRVEEEGARLRKDGSRFWSSVTITAIKDDKGEVEGFIKVTRDLTARKTAEWELERAKEKALEASSLKSQFVANVSREVRIPLAGIIGMAELLVHDHTLSPEHAEAARHIFTSAERLLEALNDILDFSKLEAGRVEVHEKEFSINQLVDDVFKSISLEAGKKNLQLDRQVDSRLPTRMLGDEMKLRQGLLNFAHNAVKFTKEGSYIFK